LNRSMGSEQLAAVVKYFGALDQRSTTR